MNYCSINYSFLEKKSHCVGEIEERRKQHNMSNVLNADVMKVLMCKPPLGLLARKKNVEERINNSNIHLALIYNEI
jgi:hypothetical protein